MSACLLNYAYHMKWLKGQLPRRNRDSIYYGQSFEAHDFTSFSWCALSPAELGNKPTRISTVQFTFFSGIVQTQKHQSVCSAESKRPQKREKTQKTLPPSTERKYPCLCPRNENRWSFPLLYSCQIWCSDDNNYLGHFMWHFLDKGCRKITHSETTFNTWFATLPGKRVAAR